MALKLKQRGKIRKNVFEDKSKCWYFVEICFVKINEKDLMAAFEGDIAVETF